MIIVKMKTIKVTAAGLASSISGLKVLHSVELNIPGAVVSMGWSLVASTTDANREMPDNRD